MCASILFLVAVLGLAGTVKHHQVVLFFVSFLERERERESGKEGGKGETVLLLS